MTLNIFWLYDIVFIFIYIMCYFNWSFLVTPIKSDLIIFFTFVSIFNLALGYIFREKLKYRKLKKEDKKLKIYYIIIILGMVCEFLYEKKIPIYEILIKKSGYSYLDFYGIPTFHVILVTLNTFLAIYSLYHYLNFKKKIYIFYFLISLTFPILLFIRGIMAFIIIPSIFLLVAHTGLNLKKIIYYSILVIGLLYFFGVAGNKRHYQISNGSSYILDIGSATPNFKNNYLIPKEFMWSYLYITTPLKNLEINYTKNKDNKINRDYLKTSYIPDFLMKRMGYKMTKEELAFPSFNVSTGYIQALLNGGKLGLYLFYLIYTTINLFYIKILYKSEYYIPAICLLQMINVLIFFYNMFIFSGASFSLVYPVIFYLIKKKRSCK